MLDPLTTQMHSVAAHGWRLVVSAVLAAILVLGIIATPPVSAQSAKDTLPPKAEKAMARGLAAARQQEWQFAIKYFKEARDSLPGYKGPPPVVSFNLALAYDKSGGAQLPAAVWYKAYLAAAPDAENAAQVQARVDELMVKYEAAVWDLIQKAEEIIALAGREFDSTGVRTMVLHEGMGWAIAARGLMGDVHKAKRLADKFELAQPNTNNREAIYKPLGDVLFDLGDFEGGKEVLKKAWRIYNLSPQQLAKGWETRIGNYEYDRKEFEKVETELEHWRTRALRGWGDAVYAFPAFWKAVKDKEDYELGLALGRAVFHMAKGWAHFQRIETLWIKRRAQAQ